MLYILLNSTVNYSFLIKKHYFDTFFFSFQNYEQAGIPDFIQTSINLFFLNVLGTEELEKIPPLELDKILLQFFCFKKSKRGGEVEPTTLKSIFSSVDRHLRDHKYSHSIQTSLDFHKTRKTIDAKRKQLKSMGKGNLAKQVQVTKPKFNCYLVGPRSIRDK